MLTRKYQIFISSTFVDLKEERKALTEQILQAGHFPSGMESFSAGNEEDLKVIHRAIDQCDVYVILVGARYGSRKDENSFTRIEFQYAKENNKPILAFLLGRSKEEYERERMAILTQYPDERNSEEELNNFRQEVKEISLGKNRIVDFFGTNDTGNLKAKFLSALNNLLDSKEIKLNGWIPGSDKLINLGPVKDNIFIFEIINKLTEFEVLTKRTQENSNLKTDMASYFWRQMFSSLAGDSEYDNIFIESGSTLAYLSHEFLSIIRNNNYSEYRDSIKIRTNNILSYIETVLTTEIKASLLPYGPPDQIYGATFGDLKKLPFRPAPLPGKLSIKEEAAIQKCTDLLKGQSRTMIMMVAASGMNLKGNAVLEGYHVGDYHNMLFKKAIIKTGFPLVLFVDSQKFFNKPFNPTHCYNIFEDQGEWNSFCKNHPVAICIGTKSFAEREELIPILNTNQFNFIDPIDQNDCEKNYSSVPLFARNNEFNKIFPSPVIYL